MMLPLDAAQKTGQVHAGSLALGKGLENRMLVAICKRVDELRQELACFQAKIKLNIRNERC